MDYQSVTELAGEPISGEQLMRMHHRYAWAASHCDGKDVVEIACGSGPGLGMLAAKARSIVAGDISAPILERARRHYGSRIQLLELDAEALPFDDASKDVILIFEALYYVRDAGRFVEECRRVLRPGGLVLIATANPDLDDFNPSPYSVRYFGVPALVELFGARGFDTSFAGFLALNAVSLRQRVLRPVKRLVVQFNLMPKTMSGKRLLKRLVFGQEIPMPAELRGDEGLYTPAAAIDGNRADGRHKVIYCTARRR